MNITATTGINGYHHQGNAGTSSTTTSETENSNASSDKVSLSEIGVKLSKNAKAAELIAAQIRVLPELRESLLNQARKKMAFGYYNSEDLGNKLSEKLIEESA
ncbi:hypothetical protein ACFL5V_08345 [Fibrobacterota bacterium]